MTLYIVVRNDSEEMMKPGKMAAQVSHATSLFEYMLEDTADITNWRDGNSFGKTIVLSGDIDYYKTIEQSFALNSSGIIFGLVNDPTFPIQDGDVVHKVPFDTCYFVFIPERHLYYFDKYTDDTRNLEMLGQDLIDLITTIKSLPLYGDEE